MEAFGKYEVIGKLGEGGFGTVYLGQDPHLKRQVAIKTCDQVSREEDRQRFYREAEISARLQHPNITTVYEFGFEGDLPFFVQEYLTGEDLSVVIDEGRDLSLLRKVEILIAVASGLGYAHDNGVVHRDVKPANIRVQEDDSVKLMDFGIARITESETKLTKTGFSVGTAAYLAPEQIEGEIAGPQADIFAFGLVAYELFTYQRAFAGPTVSALMYQILHTEPAQVSELAPDCPRRLEGLIRGCLAKDLVARYGTFADVLMDLRGIAAGLKDADPAEVTSENLLARTEVSRRPPSATGKVPASIAEAATARSATTHGPADGPAVSRFRWGALGLAALVLVGAIFWFVWRSEEPADQADGVYTESVVPTDLPAAGGSALEATEARNLPAGEQAGAGSSAVASGDPSGLGELLEEAATRAAAAQQAAERAGAGRVASTELARGRELRTSAEAVRESDPQRAVQLFWASRDAFAAASQRAEEAAAESAVASGGSEAPNPSPRNLGSESPAAGSPARGEPAPVANPDPVSNDARDRLADRPTRDEEPIAALPDPPADDVPTSTVVGPSDYPVSESADAADASLERGTVQLEIERALERYRLAYQHRSVEELVAAWPSIDRQRLANIERAFSQYRSLQLTLTNCTYSIQQDGATADCQVRQVAELAGGQSVDNTTQTVFRLGRGDSGWVVLDL